MCRSWWSARTSSIRIISPSGSRTYRSGCERASTRRASPRSAPANAYAAARSPTPGGPCRRKACAPASASAADKRRFASGCSGTDAKGSIHLLRELVRPSRGIEDDDPLRKTLGELTVPRRSAGTEVVALALEPVVVALDTRRHGTRSELEQEGPVGKHPADRGEVQLEHALEPEPARDPLVRDRRVQVAVADHRRTAFERRPDHLVDELRARGDVHERLGPRPDVVAVEDELTEPLAGGGSARLPRRHDVDAVRQ